MSEIANVDVVFWEEDPSKTRTVVRNCLRCDNHPEVYGTGVVSPTGVAHIAEGETTLCGHDATGPEWWWPL